MSSHIGDLSWYSHWRCWPLSWCLFHKGFYTRGERWTLLTLLNKLSVAERNKQELAWSSQQWEGEETRYIWGYLVGRQICNLLVSHIPVCCGTRYFWGCSVRISRVSPGRSNIISKSWLYRFILRADVGFTFASGLPSAASLRGGGVTVSRGMSSFINARIIHKTGNVRGSSPPSLSKSHSVSGWVS